MKEELKQPLCTCERPDYFCDCLLYDEKVEEETRKETFEEYLQRLKDRRTEDDYKYTDEDFENHIYYIFDCYEKDLSVYKCLEFMYFAEREIHPEQIWNDEKMEGIKNLISEHKKTLEETIDKASLLEFPIKEWYKSDDYNREEITAARDGFKRGAKWQQEQHDFLPGFIKQFDPEEGELDEGAWTVSRFLKWLELNKFKIMK